MKIQTVLCFLCGVYFNLSHAQFVKIDLKGHPWIPKKINWKEGSFETYYFYNDSCFVKITSTQSKIKNDSIIFMREPGYILHKGKYSINKENSLISLSYQLFYRTFKLTG